MKKLIYLAVVCVMAVGGVSMADTFGTGASQFTIDFVNISKATNPGLSIPAGNVNFTGVKYDYRICKYEITNDQWTIFKNAYGTVTGTPSIAYRRDPYWTGENVPTNNASWLEAAQFVNWLNLNTGHQPAYKFTGTQGTSDYGLSTWSSSEAWNGTNRFRHKDAFYFLPTENEWVKAAYWNGKTLQAYATKTGESPTQGNGISGTGWNYYNATGQPWAVGSGSQELNGTYDMMGNVWEWIENPWSAGNYSNTSRPIRGGSYNQYSYTLVSTYELGTESSGEGISIGFRVASVPEPASLTLLFLGGIALRNRKR